MGVKNSGGRLPECAPVGGEATFKCQRVEGQIGIDVARRHGDLPDHRLMFVLILEPKLGVDAVEVQTFDHRHHKTACADWKMNRMNNKWHVRVQFGAGVSRFSHPSSVATAFGIQVRGPANEWKNNVRQESVATRLSQGRIRFCSGMIGSRPESWCSRASLY